MENRINNLLEKKDNLLSIYFTAGYPNLNDTTDIIKKVVDSGADLLEIGVPFSDPVADGPTIQHSNTVAIENGMTVKLLFEQLKDIRKSVDVPLIMMSSLNPIMQYGFENFCKKCKEIDVDGLIIPDLPVEEYIEHYKSMVEENGLRNIILVTPASTDERIRLVDENTDGFIYMVSSSSTTGENKKFTSDFEHFAKRLEAMSLRNFLITGFGIKDKMSFDQVCRYSKGGIIGSAFVKAIAASDDVMTNIEKFMKQFN
ncbi:tryptophan synthase subunit alpha [Reichenbachiella carrageenanivorans]|uniref:Tryptophan synthase alpha chain n=1 Tax=Reichenbachiella carrageenanivorans TaxID=2979869 RepID=A0ABY6D1H1_9BACT|nr:tryptophan synthase subunit alpha [Reichenbachiella carrageenanivorans]UXX78913.1 tryptophan synthase subunit alpha [Reichenbachiella carrageenanivorans]